MLRKQAQDIMTREPFTCTPDSSLFNVAKLMVDHDCGAIPVVESCTSPKIVGMITDRDITCRGVAKARDAYVTRVSECMTANPITVSPDADISDCRRLMERYRIRRLVIADTAGNCIGIVCQADLATKGPEEEALALLKQVSIPPGTPSRYAQAA